MSTRLGSCRWSRLFLLFLTLLILSTSGLARTKTDVVVMKNGDRITCEIRELKHGQLVVKPPYADATLSIDWDEVDVIESEQLFQVVLTDGERLYGSIQQTALPDPDPSGQEFIVDGENQRESKTHDEVISIDQLERSFWKQLDFDIDFGFSVLKANGERQTTLNTSLKRLSRKNLISMSASSYLTRTNSAPNITRNNAKVAYVRMYENKWFVGGLADFLKNNEQQLDLRTTIGAVGGNRLVAKPNHSWDLFGGIALNNEQFTAEPARNNAELVFGTVASWYQFDSTEFETDVHLYPSLTDPGRFRIDVNTSVYLDLWSDLYFRLTFYQNYDSRPPVDASGNDYGVTTSVGWKF